jgi:hypothetical protein
MESALKTSARSRHYPANAAGFRHGRAAYAPGGVAAFFST